VTGIADDNGSGGPSSTRIAHYRYLGWGQVVDKGLERTDSGREMSVAISYDSQNSAYTGLDRFGRVIELAARDENPGQDINRYKYGYDYSSNVLWREDGATTYKDEQYIYSEKEDRVTAFKRGELDQNRSIPIPVRSQSWSLDLLGNWSTITTDQSAVNRLHNKTNEISEINPGNDPTYDAKGNMTSIPPLDGSYTYDAWHRLAEVKDGSGVTVAKFVYDGLGYCIRDDTADRDYYYSNLWRLLCERDGDAASDKTRIEYVWGSQYHDEILERDEDKNGDGDTVDASDERLCYVQDTNWNVVTLCEKDGDPVERYLYDPYGEVTYLDGSWGSRTQSSYGNRVLFQGLVWSSPAKTYRNRLREYGPYLGRFLQRDPLEESQSGGEASNLYNYVKNNPIVLTDPTGGCEQAGPRCCTCCVDSVEWKTWPVNGQTLGEFPQLLEQGMPWDRRAKGRASERWGYILQISAQLSYSENLEKDEDCTLVFNENSSTQMAANGASNGIDLAQSPDSTGVYRPWHNRKRECPSVETVNLWDTPSRSYEQMQGRKVGDVWWIEQEIWIESGSVCRCKKLGFHLVCRMSVTFMAVPNSPGVITINWNNSSYKCQKYEITETPGGRRSEAPCD